MFRMKLSIILSVTNAEKCSLCLLQIPTEVLRPAHRFRQLHIWNLLRSRTRPDLLHLFRMIIRRWKPFNLLYRKFQSFLLCHNFCQLTNLCQIIMKYLFAFTSNGKSQISVRCRYTIVLTSKFHPDQSHADKSFCLIKLLCQFFNLKQESGKCISGISASFRICCVARRSCHVDL